MKVLMGTVVQAAGGMYCAKLEWVDDKGVPAGEVLATYEFNYLDSAVEWLNEAGPTYVSPPGTVLYEKSWPGE